MMSAKMDDISQLPWSFPLVVVKKNNGSGQMWVDFRILNKKVIPISFSYPLIDDILCLLCNAEKKRACIRANT